MSHLTYLHRELSQWGYIVFVSVSLALTSMSLASASSTPGEYSKGPARVPVEACFLATEGARIYRLPACNSDPQTNSIENFAAAIRSAFKMEPGTSLPSSIRPQRYAE